MVGVACAAGTLSSHGWWQCRSPPDSVLWWWWSWRPLHSEAACVWHCEIEAEVMSIVTVGLEKTVAVLCYAHVGDSEAHCWERGRGMGVIQVQNNTSVMDWWKLCTIGLMFDCWDSMKLVVTNLNRNLPSCICLFLHPSATYWCSCLQCVVLVSSQILLCESLEGFMIKQVYSFCNVSLVLCNYVFFYLVNMSYVKCF